ncbi:hypothetical protein, partial [Comamonas kerstersii]|uniref:hypothetical protein n=2 Tax=Comamonas TaxID=283 RepID=UPI0026704E79
THDVTLPAVAAGFMQQRHQALNAIQTKASPKNRHITSPLSCACAASQKCNRSMSTWSCPTGCGNILAGWLSYKLLIHSESRFL